MADFTLYVGNKNYSSWSLRAWLMMKASGLAFDEVVIPLYQPPSRAELLRHSPSGKVPALHHGKVTVWDSMAIGEYLAEQAPLAQLWPKDAAARAHARAVSAEMHAGFADLRRHLPMNVRATVSGRAIVPAVQADLDRIAALWRDCRLRFGAGGPYLFGGFSIADVMYAPVASRLRTYGIAFADEARAYTQSLWEHRPLQDWVAAAANEPWVVKEFEV